MGIKQFSVMDFGKTGLMNPEQLGYTDSLEIIKDESYKIQKSFVKIGWYLKHIRDHELYLEGGYANIWECATDQLGYSQSTASRFINICEKFSKDHNSPELDEKYAGFDKSQMIEMLPMEPELLDRVSPDMTVKQIRDLKIEGKESCKEEEPEADDNIPGQTSLEKDFPEYMPKTEAEEMKEEMPDVYATSQKEVIDGEYRELKEPEEEKVAPLQSEESASEPAEVTQPELPVLKNNDDEKIQKKINNLLSEIIMQLEERMCSAQDEATDIECHARNRHFRDAIEIVSSYILQSQNI